MKHVARVLRVSSDSQDTERQKDSTAELANRLFPDAKVIDYVDEGVSAYSTSIFERPAGSKLVQAIERGEVEAVIADAQDRLSRGDLAEWALFAKLAAEAGTRIITVQQGELALDDFSGQLTGAITALIARKESADKSHRIASAKAARAKAGKPYHGQTVPGYRMNEDHELEATPDLEVITDLFRLFNEGATFEVLSRYANASLAPETLDRYPKGVKRDLVRRWLRNKTYIGKIEHRGNVYDGTHPAAVDEETFDRAQRKLKANKVNHVKAPRTWEFGGLLKCGECGGSLRLNPVRQRQGHFYRYLKCSRPGCKHRSHTASASEASVVVALAASALEASAILAHDKTYGENTNSGPTIREAEAACVKANARVKKLGRLVALEALDEDDPELLKALSARENAHKMLDQLNTHQNSYREELEAFVDSVRALADLAPEENEPECITEETVTLIEGKYERTFTTKHNGTGPSLYRVLAGWQRASFGQRRTVLAFALDAVTVYDETIKLHFRSALPAPVEVPAISTTVGRHAETEALEDWVQIEPAVANVTPCHTVLELVTDDLISAVSEELLNIDFGTVVIA